MHYSLLDTLVVYAHNIKYLNILHVTVCTIHLPEQTYKTPKTHKCWTPSL